MTWLSANYTRRSSSAAAWCAARGPASCAAAGRIVEPGSLTTPWMLSTSLSDLAGTALLLLLVQSRAPASSGSKMSAVSCPTTWAYLHARNHCNLQTGRRPSTICRTSRGLLPSAPAQIIRSGVVRTTHASMLKQVRNGIFSLLFHWFSYDTDFNQDT